MTLEQSLTRVAGGQPNDDIRHRRVDDYEAKQRRTRRQRQRQRRPQTSSSGTDNVGACTDSRARRTRCHHIHVVQPSQRCRTSSRFPVVSPPISPYAGAKFTGGAPSASLLPRPPSHWLTVACVS